MSLIILYPAEPNPVIFYNLGLVKSAQIADSGIWKQIADSAKGKTWSVTYVKVFCSNIKTRKHLKYFLVLMYVTSFSSISYYSNSEIDLKNAFGTDTPIL